MKCVGWDMDFREVGSSLQPLRYPHGIPAKKLKFSPVLFRRNDDKLRNGIDVIISFTGIAPRIQATRCGSSQERPSPKPSLRH